MPGTPCRCAVSFHQARFGIFYQFQDGVILAVSVQAPVDDELAPFGEPYGAHGSPVPGVLFGIPGDGRAGDGAVAVLPVQVVWAFGDGVVKESRVLYDTRLTKFYKSSCSVLIM